MGAAVNAGLSIAAPVFFGAAVEYSHITVAVMRQRAGPVPATLDRANLDGY